MEQPARETTGSGTLVVRYDAVGRKIRITGSGRWSMALLERHIEELQRLLAKARSTGSAVRILSDLSQAAVQTPEVAARIERLTVDMYSTADKIAVVVGSSLLKLQLRRIVRQARFGAFLSLSAAEDWLNAGDGAARSAPAHAIVDRAQRRMTSIITSIETDTRQRRVVRIINISASGVLFDGLTPSVVGDALCITLPSIGDISGKIVRVRGALTGLRFDQPIAVERIGLT